MSALPVLRQRARAVLLWVRVWHTWHGPELSASLAKLCAVARVEAVAPVVAENFTAFAGCTPFTAGGVICCFTR